MKFSGFVYLDTANGLVHVKICLESLKVQIGGPLCEQTKRDMI